MQRERFVELQNGRVESPRKGSIAPAAHENHVEASREDWYLGPARAWKLSLKGVGTWCLILKMPMTLMQSIEYYLNDRLD